MKKRKNERKLQNQIKKTDQEKGRRRKEEQREFRREIKQKKQNKNRMIK